MKTYRHSGAGMIEAKLGEWCRTADALQAIADAKQCTKPCKPTTKRAPRKKATK